MSTEYLNGSVILVVEEVEGIRNGIERLLATDVYRVVAAANAPDAVVMARDQRPDLILLSSGEPPLDMVAAADSIRELAALGEQVPVVIFCMKAVAEGATVTLGRNVHVISPDNFNHLRNFLNHLLRALLVDPLPS